MCYGINSSLGNPRPAPLGGGRLFLRVSRSAGDAPDAPCFPPVSTVLRPVFSGRPFPPLFQRPFLYLARARPCKSPVFFLECTWTAPWTSVGEGLHPRDRRCGMSIRRQPRDRPRQARPRASDQSRPEMAWARFSPGCRAWSAGVGPAGPRSAHCRPPTARTSWRPRPPKKRTMPQ